MFLQHTTHKLRVILWSWQWSCFNFNVLDWFFIKLRILSMWIWEHRIWSSRFIILPVSFNGFLTPIIVDLKSMQAFGTTRRDIKLWKYNLVCSQCLKFIFDRLLFIPCLHKEIIWPFFRHNRDFVFELFLEVHDFNKMNWVDFI